MAEVGLIWVRAKTEKNTFFGGASVRIRAKIEKNTIRGLVLVRVRAKVEKTPMGFG